MSRFYLGFLCGVLFMAVVHVVESIYMRRQLRGADNDVRVGGTD